jgi:hypothetical protein
MHAYNHNQAGADDAPMLRVLCVQLHCVAESTTQKVTDFPPSLQKIVGAFQMVSCTAQYVSAADWDSNTAHHPTRAQH